ncbi:MAG: hypothetical protein UHW86_11405 [Spirochaetota bacterium]|nr:hypothetical protein [Spirochaetota bacterium]
MEDRSMIKPILDALEYFSTSEEELEFFYNVVDKFCAAWFGKPVFASHFSKIDYALLHELLGEYIRFESNNKRIALWILAINRVCYNFTASLDSVKYEISEMEDSIDDSFDTTLIDPIVSSLKSFERQHLNAGVNDKGENDGVGDFLQWVGIYVTYVYPSLENKQNFYDKNIVKAMNYLLVEFIKQKSNDKRLALLILGLMESCRQYAIQISGGMPQFDEGKFFPEGYVLGGTEESMVEELLDRLKEENEKQRQKPVLSKELNADQYIKDSFDQFIIDLNDDVNESVSVFNQFANTMSNKLISFNEEQLSLFFQTLIRYRKKCHVVIKESVFHTLKRSVSLLSEQSKKWFSEELEKLRINNEIYVDYIVHKLKTEKSSKVNTAKLFVMLYLIYKLEL